MISPLFDIVLAAPSTNVSALSVWLSIPHTLTPGDACRTITLASFPRMPPFAPLSTSAPRFERLGCWVTLYTDRCCTGWKDVGPSVTLKVLPGWYGPAPR